MAMLKLIRSLQIKNQKSEAGFTLLEILLVVAMIAILAGIVILAINPGRQLANARNAQRRADVNTIMNAIYQYTIDNNGVVPAAIPNVEQNICKSTPPIDCNNLIDLRTALTENERYLTGLPNDPLPSFPGGYCLDTNSTCYTVVLTANGRVTVSAPSAELGATISITR